MFEKLVVSTYGGRKHRTVWFFGATSLAYLVIIASALAISVLASAPKLVENCVSSRPAVIELPRQGRTDQPAGGPSRPSTAPDPRRVVNFDDLSRTPLARRTEINTLRLPTIDPSIESDEGDGPGGPGRGGNGGLQTSIPGDGGERAEYVPPPPPTPRRAEPDKGPVRVPSKILQGHAVERYSPDYPKIAQQVGVHGEVSVEVILSPDGSVESARAINGHPLLASCAVEAARRWRFQPTLLNGVAVRVTGVITFVFKLNQ